VRCNARLSSRLRKRRARAPACLPLTLCPVVPMHTFRPASRMALPLLVPGSRLVCVDWDARLPTAASAPVMCWNCLSQPYGYPASDDDRAHPGPARLFRALLTPSRSAGRRGARRGCARRRRQRGRADRQPQRRSVPLIAHRDRFADSELTCAPAGPAADARLRSSRVERWRRWRRWQRQNRETRADWVRLVVG
jgi:hypothetical protein